MFLKTVDFVNISKLTKLINFVTKKLKKRLLREKLYKNGFPMSFQLAASFWGLFVAIQRSSIVDKNLTYEINSLHEG